MILAPQLFKNSINTQEKLRLNLHSLSVSELLEYGRNTQKSTGPDDIPNRLLKTCAPTLSDPLSSIFNVSIAQGFIPNVWKSADVLAIPKVLNPKSVDDDLKPISLTPVLSKILERFVFR
jgi:hypothetical protein